MRYNLRPEYHCDSGDIERLIQTARHVIGGVPDEDIVVSLVDAFKCTQEEAINAMAAAKLL